MNDYLDEVIRLYGSKRFADALLVLEKITSKRFPHPSILLWKSRCLQLVDSVSATELSEIEALLKEALELDDEYVPALIDLGYFYLRILDDAEKATPLFEKALDICRDNTTEIVIGLAECISETESPETALKFLAKNGTQSIDKKKADILTAELQPTV